MESEEETAKQPLKITAEQAREKVSQGAMLVDVRTPKEFDEGHISGCKHINSEEAHIRYNEFGDDKNREIVLYCRSGGRAGTVGEFLIELGYTNVYNAGGYEQLASVFSDQ